MTTKPAPPICRGVVPSAPSELAWILDLATQTARYAEPALAELDGSLVPGARGLRSRLMERTQRLWGDGLPGCPELVPLAFLAGCLLDDRVEPLLGTLQAGGVPSATDLELLTESPDDRKAIVKRLGRLRRDGLLRGEYRALLMDAWKPAAATWAENGRAAVREACVTWKARLKVKPGSLVETNTKSSLSSTWPLRSAGPYQGRSLGSKVVGEASRSPTSRPSSSRNTQRSTRTPSLRRVMILFEKAAFSGAPRKLRKRVRDWPAT